VKGRSGAQGRRGRNQEDKNQGTCQRVIKTREAESRDGGGYQHSEGKTAGRSKNKQISNIRADNRVSIYSISRMLLAENRGR
jgi:hypothetical protein